MTDVTIVVEGQLDVVVAQTLLSHVGLRVRNALQKNGRINILSKLSGYRAAAKHSPWFVMMDLDNDLCASEILDKHGITNEDQLFSCRFAVREIESWILADAKNVSRFLGVSATKIPANPDSLNDPKQSLLSLARQSRRRNIREGLVPRPESLSEVGANYNIALGEFVKSSWDIEAACVASQSLNRAVVAIKSFSGRLSVR